MDILLIGLLTFFAATVGTLSGFGTSTIMVPVLSLFFPLPQTLFLVGVIHLFDDIWKMALFREGIRWPLILGFGIPGIAASYIGARTAVSLPESSMLRVLGLFLVAYTIYLMVNPVFRLPQSLVTAAGGGALSGFMAGIFGVGGAVRSAFLTVFDLPKAVYIATTGAIAFAIDSTRLVTYYSGGTRLEAFLTLGFALFIPASLAGAAAAKRISGHIPQEWYRAFIALLLFIVGVKFLIFGR